MGRINCDALQKDEHHYKEQQICSNYYQNMNQDQTDTESVVSGYLSNMSDIQSPSMLDTSLGINFSQFQQQTGDLSPPLDLTPLDTGSLSSNHALELSCERDYMFPNLVEQNEFPKKNETRKKADQSTYSAQTLSKEKGEKQLNIQNFNLYKSLDVDPNKEYHKKGRPQFYHDKFQGVATSIVGERKWNTGREYLPHASLTYQKPYLLPDISVKQPVEKHVSSMTSGNQGHTAQEIISGRLQQEYSRLDHR